jgi:hypothetical protein
MMIHWHALNMPRFVCTMHDAPWPCFEHAPACLYHAVCTIVIKRQPDVASPPALNLAEVQLYGADGNQIPRNALEFRLSSVLGSNFAAAKCNNGITTSGHDDIGHTDANDLNPTLTLGYPCDYGLRCIVVENRKDCCNERINNFQLEPAGATPKFPVYYFADSRSQYTVDGKCGGFQGVGLKFGSSIQGNVHRERE